MQHNTTVKPEVWCLQLYKF